ncbi:hypothetical protein BI49514_02241 [Brevibacterium iodinum ATCC 49514]|uniref:HEAT repeat-containing protein n=1 Tax=Brevibacterium iodinum ATCC 49514 TaxID=1255616 RepID=A0A2H1JQG0_9MICO|nr:hypothetical protein [Brevibacterium iodinum]SMX89661.1 hypothetical protein BI49514_02241 [Brevibacterium iodinum ATCC 49514]SUW13884.1 Uncharacterised protein [Brevibacterium iodinum]
MTHPLNSHQRLQAAMAIGTRADHRDLAKLIARCRIEPDFFVRDMLTWALTRLPADDTVARLIAELDSPLPQAISQSMHTLSKIGDVRLAGHGPGPDRHCIHRPYRHRGGPQRVESRRCPCAR